MQERQKPMAIPDLPKDAEPRSSSGLGRRPFKAEITGSTPVRGIFSREA